MTNKRVSNVSDTTIKTFNRLSYQDKNYISSSDQNLKINNEEEIIINQGSRISIYVLFLLINIVINMDCGNIPAATNQISTDLNINSKSLGAFASLVSLGTFFGGIISFSVINSISRKWTVIIANIGVCVCLFTFPISNNIVLLYANRIVEGIFQSYCQVFFPVWVDQFGTKNGKAIMISLLQTAVPIGIVGGYLMTALLVNYEYSVSNIF